ncbi:MAG: hypothetical protein ABIN24_15040 [Dyadobacter sp.]
MGHRNSYKLNPWSKHLYASLLPSSWRSYNAIYESFWAGANNRSEIIMHGTTINPHYYKGQPYYPQTPSPGCLCSYEQWDKNGKLTISSQQKIVDALKSGSKSGHVVVFNLDNKRKPVRIEEILSFVR